MTSKGPRNNKPVVGVRYQSHCVAGVHLLDVLLLDWRKEEFHEIFANGSKTR